MFVTFCSLFNNRLRPFRDFIHHTVTSINHPSHQRHEMFRACNDFCTFLSRTVLNTFTLQMCSCISACLYLIVSRHCSLQFIRLSCLFIRTPKELFIVVAIFSWQTFSASLFPVLLLFKCFEHRNDDVWLKRPFVLLFLDQQQHERRMSLTPVSHHQQLWSMISVFCHHPYQWMTAFTHRQLQNVLLTLLWHSPRETVTIDIAELLSFRKKITWEFESRSQFFND